MQTAPVMPPPRPPREGNFPMDADDWHDNPKGRRWAKLLFLGKMFMKLLVFALFAVAVGQVGFILFRIVYLQFFF